MKVVILAGGFGTRLSEETIIKPKPMVEIGGMPILWHIMKIYSHYGYNEFIICLGYKGYMIKEYFTNYYIKQSDLTIDLQSNCVEVHLCNTEPWRITLVDTGMNTMTGGRLLKVKKYIGAEQFMMTYGDGVANIRIDELVRFHNQSRTIATITAVQPAGRFGILKIGNDNLVYSFKEKPTVNEDWINAGFFVLEPQIFDYLENETTVFEKEPLEKLAAQNQLKAYKHCGFWMPMDKLSDKIELEKLWNEDKAPWKIW